MRKPGGMQFQASPPDFLRIGVGPAPRSAGAAAGDYWSLIKPAVVLFHLVTAATSMVLAAGGVPGRALLTATLVGGGLVAAASNVLNGYYDRDIDRLMPRTASRPLPAGRLAPVAALIFAAVLASSGVLLLVSAVNWQSAVLAFGALVYYVLVYTVWLKRRTCWGSVIGSGAGAFPPLIGWMAVTGRIEPTAFLLFGVVVLWTLPHFWSLAIWRGRDYLSAGLGMIPARHASLWILASALLLSGASLGVWKVAHQGNVYLVAALLLDCGLLFMSGRLNLKAIPENGRKLFFYSNAYLVALCAFLLGPNLL